MQMLVPLTLETDRLILRQFREEDWHDLHEYYSDIDSTKYTVGRAFTEAETWRTMSCMIGHWQIRGYGPYAVVEKSSQKVMGPIGFWYPNDWPSPEIKWALSSAFRGKGYASEAARKVHETGKHHLPDIRLISVIHPDNQPSIQLAKAVGAKFEKIVNFRDGTWQVYRHK